MSNERNARDAGTTSTPPADAGARLASDAGELSDDSLESVAGGGGSGFCTPCPPEDEPWLTVQNPA